MKKSATQGLLTIVLVVAVLFWLFWIAGAFDGLNGPAQVVFSTDVFVGGAEGPNGTPNYRIPGMILTGDGVLLAFVEGRRGPGDPGSPGHIDLAMKRSEDGGRTWSPLTIIDSDPEMDFANPTPLFDFVTETAFIVYDQFPDNCGSNEDCVGPGNSPDPQDRNQVVWYRTSMDNGLTWSDRSVIPKPLRGSDGKYLRTGTVGPGSGIQLRRQSDTLRNGRLVLPGRRAGAETRDGPRVSVEPFVYYSDDHGETWKTGAATNGPSANESEVVELASGDLLLDARQSEGTSRRRHLSRDGGLTWGPDVIGDAVITTVDASLVRYSAVQDGDARDRLLFSGPVGDPPGSGQGRQNLAVWISYDEGKTFTPPKVVAEGYGAYSVLQRLKDGTVALLYEATPNTVIRLLVLDLSYIEGGGDPE